jgi:hypothetical protein
LVNQTTPRRPIAPSPALGTSSIWPPSSAPPSPAHKPNDDTVMTEDNATDQDNAESLANSRLEDAKFH